MATTSGFDWQGIRERLRATQAAVERDAADDPDRRRAVLEARSRLLAARGRRAVDAGDLAVLEVLLDHERYAFALAALAGIVAWRRLGPIPNGPAEMLGMLNGRGHIWCVYSLSRLLGLPGGSDQEAGRIVLLRHPRLRVGLRVSATVGVLRLDGATLAESGDEQFGGDKTFVRGMGANGLIVLDEAALLRHPAITEGD